MSSYLHKQEEKLNWCLVPDNFCWGDNPGICSLKSSDFAFADTVS